MAGRIMECHDLSESEPFNHLFDQVLGTVPKSFCQAVAPISSAVIPDVQARAESTFRRATERKKKSGSDPRIAKIGVDDLAAIIKYCDEDSTPAFYKAMNQACYGQDRTAAKPFVPYMWLLINALHKLPIYSEAVVFRGVKLNLANSHWTNRVVTWYGFTSTTKTQKVLEHEHFCGKSGDRTFFVITLTQGQARDISAFSPLPEGEVLLPPCSRFQVSSDPANLAPGLYVIHLKELKSDEWIIDMSKTQKTPNTSAAKPLIMLTAKEWLQIAKDGGGQVLDKRYDKRECIEKALELNVKDANAWNLLGAAGGGQVQAAQRTKKQCFEIALSLDEHFAAAWRNLAEEGGGEVKGKMYTKEECANKGLEPEVKEASLRRAHAYFAKEWDKLGPGRVVKKHNTTYYVQKALEVDDKNAKAQSVAAAPARDVGYELLRPSDMKDGQECIGKVAPWKEVLVDCAVTIICLGKFPFQNAYLVMAVATQQGGVYVFHIAAQYSDPSHGASEPLQKLRFKGHTKAITYMSFGVRQDQLVTSSSDGRVRVWKTKDGTMMWETIESSMVACALPMKIPEGGLLIASEGVRDTPPLLRLCCGQDRLQKVQLEHSARSLVASVNGEKALAGSSKGLVLIFDVKEECIEQRNKLQATHSAISCLTIVEPGDGSLPLVMANSTEDILCIMQANREITNLTVYKRIPNPHTMLPIRNCYIPATAAAGFIVSGSEEPKLNILDMENFGSVQWKAHKVPVIDAAVSNDNTLLATGDVRGTIILWRRSPG